MFPALICFSLILKHLFDLEPNPKPILKPTVLETQKYKRMKSRPCVGARVYANSAKCAAIVLFVYLVNFAEDY